MSCGYLTKLADWILQNSDSKIKTNFAMKARKLAEAQKHLDEAAK